MVELGHAAVQLLRELTRRPGRRADDDGAARMGVRRRAVALVEELLLAAGRLTPAAGDLLELPVPPKPSPGVELPSKRLARMRRAER